MPSEYVVVIEYPAKRVVYDSPRGDKSKKTAQNLASVLRKKWQYKGLKLVVERYNIKDWEVPEAERISYRNH